MERFCLRIPRISSRTASFLGWVWGPCLSSRKKSGLESGGNDDTRRETILGCSQSVGRRQPRKDLRRSRRGGPHTGVGRRRRVRGRSEFRRLAYLVNSP